MILLSNLLDNAIRESEKVLKNTGKADIHLKLECEDHKLIFAVRNPVTEKVEIENDTIKSKRGDHHGIGLLNVKAVVDKYGGDMVCMTSIANGADATWVPAPVTRWLR